MPRLPDLRSRAGLCCLTALAALYLAGVVPLGLQIGTHIEEVAGLLTKPVNRVGPGVAVDGAVGLRVSRDLPVWSYQAQEGTYTPLMVDAHVGAMSFLPYRLAERIGGLLAARTLAWLGGLALLVVIWLLGNLFQGRAVAWLATLLAASSPHFSLVHHWSRPDEQWSFALPALCILAIARHRQRGSARWLITAGLMAGLAVAAKNTAVWTLVAIAIGMWWQNLWPRARARAWLAALAAATVALLPELAFVSASADPGSFWVRVGNLPALGDSLSADRLAFFLDHFLQTFGGLGEFFERLVTDRSSRPGSLSIVTGSAALALTCVAASSALSSRATPPEKAFGVGLVALFLLYLTMYYVGMSLFILLTPWVPLAVAAGWVRGWRALSGLEHRQVRGLLRGAFVACLLLLIAGHAHQSVLLHQAFAKPRYGVFHLQTQQELADALVADGHREVWTTTYSIAGVPEQLSDNALRGRNVFPLIRHHCGQPTGYAKAWRELLARWPPGRHVVLMSPRPSEVDTSPCEHAEQIATTFEAAVREWNLQLGDRREYTGPGGTVLYTTAVIEVR